MHTPEPSLEIPAASPNLWPLDPGIVFLNHGSFGSCPTAVLDFQARIRDRLERQPVQFFVRDLERLWDEARAELADFVGARPDDLVFVPNATSGLNTILRSLDLNQGDELLVTNHEYNACRNALNFVAERSRARVVEACVDLPLRDSAQIVAALLEKVTDRTRLLLIDHVTSQTGLVLPVAEIVSAMRERGIETLVDGAHAPGMLPLNLEHINADYYTGNCHKWICAPKGAAFLHVRRDRQSRIRPLVISHGANSPRAERSRFLIEFGWTGTSDVSAALAVPEALRYVGGLLPGGWPEIMRRNRMLALAARDILHETLGGCLPAPREMIGSLVSLPLPEAASTPSSKSPLYLDPLQDWLLDRGHIEVPIIPWPNPASRLLRISAQLYNSLPQYRLLAELLREALA